MIKKKINLFINKDRKKFSKRGLSKSIKLVISPTKVDLFKTACIPRNEKISMQGRTRSLKIDMLILFILCNEHHY